MEAEWAIGKFTGDAAKSVKAHADAGLGYFVRQESGRGTGYTVTAAFRRTTDAPLPDHLVKANWSQIKKLEQMRVERSGAYNANNNAK